MEKYDTWPDISTLLRPDQSETVKPGKHEPWQGKPRMSEKGLMSAVGKAWLEAQVGAALHEDLAKAGDITSAATVPEALQGFAELVAKGDGILCGVDWAVICGDLTDPPVTWEFLVTDGESVHPDQVLARIYGPMRGILISERTTLNGLGHLSGIATAAAQAMELVAGTDAQVIDTRKTFPGWRLAEKYAVRCGGAGNHRIGLYDEILIKENHVEAAGGVKNAVLAAKKWREQEAVRSAVPIEVEVRNLEEFHAALETEPDRILLDNFALEAMREAVNLAKGSVTLEASGGITLRTLAEVAATGVNRISLGALTHSVVPLDITLLVRKTTEDKSSTGTSS
jgi:nicotinate-nucleotide pyrophosphorylase (carboxylating)